MRQISIDFNSTKSYIKTIALSLCAIIVLSITSCDTSKIMNFTVQHQQILNVPSASGIVIFNEDLYVIGDNSAYLFQLDDHYDVSKRLALMDQKLDGIIPKASKPDFEAITAINVNGKKELLVFGSGSKSPERDIIIRVDMTNGFKTKTYSAEAIYAALRNSEYLNVQNLNIEAAATIENKLYLFNREEHLILEYKMDEFLGYLEDLNPLPNYNVYRISLPQLNGIQAKFSGASDVTGLPQLVFTASVEDSPNTYDDGEVTGSYVGIININELEDGYHPKTFLISDENKPIPIKVESIEVIKNLGSNELIVVLISDSDGGESKLLTGALKW